MKSASAGATTRNPDNRPPWIVVDHSIESIVVAKWPGRLWKVEILRRAPEQPSAPAKYTRAVSVNVLDEQPVAALFGPHGDLVCEVIEKARSLELEDVRLLGQSNPAARETYSRAWDRWLRSVGEQSFPDGNHAETLEVSGTRRSPIGAVFTVLHTVLSERARALVGPAAFIVDDEGEESFTADWSAAADAFLHAAMAQGAPELLAPGEAEVLTSAWATLPARGGRRSG